MPGYSIPDFPDIPHLIYLVLAPTVHSIHSLSGSRYYSDQIDVNEFVQQLGQKLGINQLNEWYHVSRAQIGEVASLAVLRKHGGLAALLQKAYHKLLVDKCIIFDTI
jgi:hypothetical protein